MNERGFTLIEFVISLMIVSILLFATFFMYQQMNEQSGQVLDEWKVFWITKSLIRQWQNQQPSSVDGEEDYEIKWTERMITPQITEGELRIRWNSTKKTKEKIIYAYKRAEPSPSY